MFYDNTGIDDNPTLPYCASAFSIADHVTYRDGFPRLMKSIAIEITKIPYMHKKIERINEGVIYVELAIWSGSSSLEKSKMFTRRIY